MPFTKGHQINKGKKYSKTHRVNISKALKGKPLSEKRKIALRKLHNSLKGKPSKRKRPVNKICPVCKKEFITNPSQNHIFCSKPCAYIGRSTSNVGRKKGGKNKVSKLVKCICQSCKKEFYKCPTSIKAGQGKFCSKECYWQALSKRKEGKNCNFWKHGKSKLNKTKRRIAMQTYKYRKWRRQVFERDDYTCQRCKGGKSSYIEAHHIKSWEKYPKLRYKVFNGITLCPFCHGTKKVMKLYKESK